MKTFIIICLGVVAALIGFSISHVFRFGSHSIIPVEVETKNHNVSIEQEQGGGFARNNETPNWVWTSKIIEKLSKEEGINVTLLTHDLHDYKSAFRSIRKDIFTWQNVSESITVGSRDKEQFCTLYRDNWSCTGATYENFLNQTRSYNQSLDMRALKENSRLLIHGNSLIGQVGMTIICNTVGAVVWMLGERATSNSMVAYYPKRNVTMILLSNFSPGHSYGLSLLKRIGYTPDYTVSGFYNSWVGISKPRSCDDTTALARASRQKTLEIFPKTDYFEFFNHVSIGGNRCCADFKHCKPRRVGFCHHCVPGPVNLASEHVIQLLMNSEEQSPTRMFDNIIRLLDTNATICNMSTTAT